MMRSISRGIAVLTLVLTTGPAFAQSGLQITPDGMLILISKDVGADRWSISATADLEVVTGNIFPLDGSNPRFVYCDLLDVAGPVGPDQALTYGCQEARNCAGTSCPSTDWQSIGEPVLPRSFFQPDGVGVVALAAPLRLAPAVSGLGAVAQLAPAGAQITPDSSVYLINKDVGTQRWAIAFDASTGRATGNVFFAEGGSPVFLSCDRIGDDQNPDIGQRMFTFDCLGSDSCRGGGCDASSWSSIAQVDLPADFFLARTANAETEAETTVRAVVDSSRYVDLGSVAAPQSGEGASGASSVPAGLESVSGFAVSLDPGQQMQIPCFIDGGVTVTCSDRGDHIETVHEFDQCEYFFDFNKRRQFGQIVYRHDRCVGSVDDLRGQRLEQEFVDLIVADLDLETDELFFGQGLSEIRDVEFGTNCPGTVGDTITRTSAGATIIIDSLDELQNLSAAVGLLWENIAYTTTLGASCLDFTFSWRRGVVDVIDLESFEPVAQLSYGAFSNQRALDDAGTLFVQSAGVLRDEQNVLSTDIAPTQPLQFPLGAACPTQGEFDIDLFGARIATARFTDGGGVEVEHASGRVQRFGSCLDLP